MPKSEELSEVEKQEVEELVTKIMDGLEKREKLINEIVDLGKQLKASVEKQEQILNDLFKIAEPPVESKPKFSYSRLNNIPTADPLVSQVENTREFPQQ